MTRSFHLQKVTIRARAVYQCDNCGVSAIGDSFTAEFDAISQIDRHLPGPHLMPIGWSSHHSTNPADHLAFNCPSCTS